MALYRAHNGSNMTYFKWKNIKKIHGLWILQRCPQSSHIYNQKYILFMAGHDQIYFIQLKKRKKKKKKVEVVQVRRLGLLEETCVLLFPPTFAFKRSAQSTSGTACTSST